MNKVQVNYFHCSADNVGDRLSGPAQYLWPTKFINHELRHAIPEDVAAAIIGGGQIFKQLERLIRNSASTSRKSKIFVWGVGLPIFGTQKTDLKALAERTSAFSTRNYDWHKHLPFVPCASCLSSLFDATKSPSHEFVVYSHRRKPGALGIPAGTPTMQNSWRDPKVVIDFISSGETVVTSSYHGVYWAQLLGRRVVCIPYNSKFQTFQYKPAFAEASNWTEYISSAPKTDPLLEEYRHRNMMFASLVQEMLNA